MKKFDRNHEAISFTNKNNKILCSIFHLLVKGLNDIYPVTHTVIDKVAAIRLYNRIDIHSLLHR